MHQRINITLPQETLRLIDRVTKRGNRSQFIDKAVRYYIKTIGRENLRKRLKEEAISWAESNLRLAEEWFVLDEEAWRQTEK